MFGLKKLRSGRTQGNLVITFTAGDCSKGNEPVETAVLTAVEEVKELVSVPSQVKVNAQEEGAPAATSTESEGTKAPSGSGVVENPFKDGKKVREVEASLLQAYLGLKFTPFGVEKMSKLKFPYPFNFMTPLQEVVYNTVYGEAVKYYQARVCDVSGRVIEYLVLRAKEEELKEKKLLLHPKDFCTSQEQILCHIWNATMNQESRLIIVGDDARDAKYYQYTKKTPTYAQITPGELNKCVYQWARSIFGGRPPASIASTTFVERFVSLITTQFMISNKEFRRTFEVSGVAFKENFAAVLEGAEKVRILPYNSSLFTEQEPVKQNYSLPRITDGKIAMQKQSLDLIEVLTRNKLDRVNILRGMLRRVVTANYEGRNFQTGAYICGPPGTSKSFIIELLKKLVTRKYIQELNKYQNQFSSGQFKDCRLLIVSDMKRLKAETVEVIKQLLGRDSMATQIKYLNGTEFIEPSCFVVIVSNTDLEDFYPLSSDQAIKDKLLVWRFSNEDQIPEHLQVANARDQLDFYICDLLNWAMHSPKAVLDGQKRAVGYAEYQKKEKGNESSMVYYLNENFWWSKNSFTEINEIATHLELHAKATGNDALISFKKRALSDIGTSIENACKMQFRLEVEFTRSTKLNAEKKRPMGMRNLRLKGDPLESCPAGCRPLEVVCREDGLQLPAILEASEKIVWFNSTSNSLAAATQQILLDRHQKAAAREKLEAEAALMIEAGEEAEIIDVDPSSD